jgi:hypothetical protein
MQSGRRDPWRWLLEGVRIASALIVVVGVWEIASPFVLGYSGSATPTINAILVGFLVVICGGIRFLRPRDTSWLSWLCIGLGAWLIVAPFLLSYGNPARINDILVGMTIAVCGMWSALVSEEAGTI